MQQLLADFGLHDCVTQPPHTSGHQLDVFVTRDGCEPWSVDVQPPMLSDHSMIIVDTQTPVTRPSRSSVCRRRRWAAFCLDNFISELNQSQLSVDPPTNVDDLLACYDDTISNILDRLAPVTDVKRYARDTSPWYDHDCHVADAQAGKNIPA